MISPGNGSQVIALVPVVGKPLCRSTLGGKPLLSYTIEAARQSRCIDRVIVTTEDEELAELARQGGTEVPFMRPPELARENVSLERVLQHAVEWIETHEGHEVGVVVLLEVSHPFRMPGLIDQIVDTLIEGEWDSVFPAREERDTFWFLGEEGLSRIGEGGHFPRGARKPIYREISGLACATRGGVIKRGDRLGYRVGMVPIRDISGLVDIRSVEDLQIAECLLPAWKKLVVDSRA